MTEEKNKQNEFALYEEERKLTYSLWSNALLILDGVLISIFSSLAISNKYNNILILNFDILKLGIVLSSISCILILYNLLSIRDRFRIHLTESKRLQDMTDKSLDERLSILHKIVKNKIFADLRADIITIYIEMVVIVTTLIQILLINHLLLNAK